MKLRVKKCLVQRVPIGATGGLGLPHGAFELLDMLEWDHYTSPVHAYLLCSRGTAGLYT